MKTKITLRSVIKQKGDSKFLFKLVDWLIQETGDVNLCQRLGGIAFAKQSARKETRKQFEHRRVAEISALVRKAVRAGNDISVMTVDKE